MVSRDNSSTSFGTAAEVYESARPEYPSDSVAWLLEPAFASGRTPRVADVGAGTGKLTRSIVAAGCDAIAVDPDTAMLDALRIAVPGVPTLVGTAESLPVDDESLDGVLLGQAWHWVDPVAASREIGRVLRPGGVLGLVWNIRDESQAWVRRLNSVVLRGGAMAMFDDGPPPIAEPFDHLEERRWAWSRTVNRSLLTDLVRSRSFYITASVTERSRIDQDLAALFDELGLQGSTTIGLPYVSRAFRCTRPHRDT
ncbi:class I SAM-dependent methyltransferase [Rhodococcus sp. IEGM 1381]|uniref:class I SAM-dependent methyltransferase n=1 Tax=Rhodococcus sp. IEGM 1381 TaxID=3047085 RepID=UPI0024B79220|nr:class I SAM-dependent methyltransferase [Rhodococcus sp. IEGM 1381]MDI9893751.1 class I SAM-dependent methyltransferase [Rhodococcus sp. IEGM 1381]